MASLTINKNPKKGKLTNSGTTELSKQRLISQIVTKSPFKELFPINEATLLSIQESIQERGYDQSQPIHVWKEENILLDGHTRLQASLNNKLKQIPVFEHSFSSEEEALEYAISLQTNRRNLSDAEMLSCFSQLDQLKKAGRKSASNKAQSPSGKSAIRTAEILGTSRAKVEKMRSIQNHASPKTIEAVTSGKKTINLAYTETMGDKKKKIQNEPSLSPLSPQPSETQKPTASNIDANNCRISMEGSRLCVFDAKEGKKAIPIVTIHKENHPIIKENSDLILESILKVVSPLF